MSKNFKRFIVVVLREYKGKEKTHTQYGSSVFVDGDCYPDFLCGNGKETSAVEDVIDKLAEMGKVVARIKDKVKTESLYGYCERTQTVLHVERVRVKSEKDMVRSKGNWTNGYYDSNS
jgi:hypothetical protein